MCVWAPGLQSKCTSEHCRLVKYQYSIETHVGVLSLIDFIRLDIYHKVNNDYNWITALNNCHLVKDSLQGNPALRLTLLTKVFWEHHDQFRPVHKNILFGISKNAVQFCVIFWLINKCYKRYFAKISLGFGSHLFYKTEYMGRSCLNQVYAINFNLSAPHCC